MVSFRDILDRLHDTRDSCSDSRRHGGHQARIMRFPFERVLGWQCWDVSVLYQHASRLYAENSLSQARECYDDYDQLLV